MAKNLDSLELASPQRRCSCIFIVLHAFCGCSLAGAGADRVGLFGKTVLPGRSIFIADVGICHIGYSLALECRRLAISVAVSPHITCKRADTSQVARRFKISKSA